MRNFETDRQFLEEIEAWLTFNIEPTKENLIELRRDINKHISNSNTAIVSHKKEPNRATTKDFLLAEVKEHIATQVGYNVVEPGYADSGKCVYGTNDDNIIEMTIKFLASKNG